jgi:hypothetical protein
VREKLQKAPWWVWSLITGVYFGAGMTVFTHFQQSVSWTAAMVGGMIGGVFFGAVMGPLVTRLHRKGLAAGGDLPARDLRVASRAVMRGPVPLDSDIRTAAARLARLQLDQYSGRRLWLGVILFGTLTLLAAFLALTESPWWWIEFPIFLAFGALNVMLPRHLRRRLEILSQEP